MIYPTQVDVGREVIYTPPSTGGDPGHSSARLGRLVHLQGGFMANVRLGSALATSLFSLADLHWVTG